MPFCNVEKQSATESGSTTDENGVKIFYRTYGRGPTKVLLIIGLAGTLDSWRPQIQSLAGPGTANEYRLPCDGAVGTGIEVCAFDNRGMGRSTTCRNKYDYSTQIMALDALALMNHLGWKKSHVVGHSMGAMVGCKLAALAPQRVLSLALLSVTGGGFECLPRLDRQTISIAYRFLTAKTPELRAAVDLDTHYTQEHLSEIVGSKTRRSILYQEYVKSISSRGMQSCIGFDGQIHACRTHSMTWPELEVIRSSGILVTVIHGRHDVIAQIYYARRLAHKLHPVARMVELHGGHLVSHERPDEVNNALLELIRASEKNMNPLDWSSMPARSSDGKYISKTATDVAVFQRSCIKEALSKILFHIFHFIASISENLCRAHGRLKSARVTAALL